MKYPEKYIKSDPEYDNLRLSFGDDITIPVCAYCGYQKGSGHDYACKYINQGESSFL